MLGEQGTGKVAICRGGKRGTASLVCTVGEDNNCRASTAAWIWYIQDTKWLEVGTVSIWGEEKKRAQGWNHSCSNKGVNPSLGYTHMCRCRLISASICPLVNEHLTGKQTYMLSHRACCWQDMLGKGPLWSTLHGDFSKGLYKVFVVQQHGFSSGMGRACFPDQQRGSGWWRSPVQGCCERWQSVGSG